MKKTNEELSKYLMDKFFETHPRKELPTWFGKYAKIDSYFNRKEGNLILEIFFYLKRKLKQDEFWEDFNGIKVPAKIDENTGEKLIVMKYDNEPYCIFKASISVDGKVSIIQNRTVEQILSLDKSDFVENNL